MHNLVDQLRKSFSIEQFELQVKAGNSIVVEELLPSAKAFVAAEACHLTKKSLLIITGAGSEEFKLFNDLPFFAKEKLIELPSWETLPSENIAPSPDIVGSRYQALHAISHEKESVIVLSSIQAALQKVLPKKTFQKRVITLKLQSKYKFEDLVQELQRMGYERKGVATDKGEFAVRGGIIDIFPVTSQEPFRLEFFGDEIDSIRAFDPVGQKSTRPITEIEIGPAKELELLQNESLHLETIFDYLGPDTIVILDDLEALEDRYASLTSLGATPSKTFLGIEEFLDIIDKYQKISFTNTSIEKLSEVETDKSSKAVKFYSLKEAPHEIRFEMFHRKFHAKRWIHPFEKISDFLERECLLDEEIEGEALLDAISEIHENLITYYTAQNEAEEATLKKRLDEKGLLHSASGNILQGYLSTGFAVKDLKLVLFPLTELTHRIKVRRERVRNYYHFTGADAFDVSPGETIVHYNHGIGKFIGIESRKNNLGVEQEFFQVEYADNARMFVPLTQAHLITKYVGAGEQIPKYHAIGSSRWKKQREQTEKSILGFASELLKLYATRKVQGGFVFPEDGEETKAFDEEFPYIETDDQLQAITDAKTDMCSGKAMDRLICGDVGYGKTEVALRASFKAVVDGKKQVAVLVPTTVLAVQHYETFVDRMKSFGINVALLSRFQKASEVKQVLEKASQGKVDVIVGTHRLLQEDVRFKDLGLVIIDEEQRFGVKAKEHLKKLKSGVDCLTLTATPIPRTLYMSLVGARDLSVINTPPQDRLPIKTVIADPDDVIIQTALLRELNRDGQAYFIHNRVESIYSVADRLKQLLPKARIVVGHGQMSGEELDLVFHAFKKGDADILVATSIVENGIDIPNANTILIDNADHFGISDLYQLRGRVGRWNRRAYAYFLIPKRRTLTEIARKRLEAIAQAGGYGGGIKVAMRDLEIRGAGDILGVEQSGHVADVGFHLYCKLLKRTIDSMQGKAPSWTLETKIEIPYDARLPEFYVNEVNLRMEIYQRLGDALTLEEVDAIWEEVKDRFGKPPEQALWLYHQSRIRVFASQRGFTLVKIENLSLSYEKKSGNQSLTNKVLIGRIKGPVEMEEKVFKMLSNA
jgi:transcription-repair coupling factor (superfamily II helicase)